MTDSSEFHLPLWPIRAVILAYLKKGCIFVSIGQKERKSARKIPYGLMMRTNMEGRTTQLDE